MYIMKICRFIHDIHIFDWQYVHVIKVMIRQSFVSKLNTICILTRMAWKQVQDPLYIGEKG